VWVRITLSLVAQEFAEMAVFFKRQQNNKMFVKTKNALFSNNHSYAQCSLK
jgi:hypothetical protein